MSAGGTVARTGAAAGTSEADSTYAWMRLVAAVLMATIGGVGMWSVVVVLPSVQAEFGVARAHAALPYTVTMIGFGLGGVLMGRLSDRLGIAVPVAFGAVALGVGYLAAGSAGSLWQFTLAQGLLIAFLGSSATFGPLLANTSLWFLRRRGMAVAIAASGSYLAGAVWPPVVQHFIEVAGWRQTYMGIGVFCWVTMLPLVLALRRRPPAHPTSASGLTESAWPARPLGMPRNVLQIVLLVAGLSCCVAMSMPQVHIVAYCADLGYGPARGAEMLSLMLGFGIVSRLAFGWIADRLGGLRTLLLGSSLQALALVLFVPFDGLVSLYAISILFGLFQGGIVPAYAIVVREYFPPAQAGTRVSMVLTATLFGMALGGWMSAALFDLTGSYAAAFANGIAWNVLNIAIAAWLLWRSGGRPRAGVRAPVQGACTGSTPA